MAYLEWKSAFDTGIPGIDYEHHRLVDMLNEIHALIVDGGEKRKVAGILAEFHTLAAAHFALEERIMRDQGFKGLAARRDIHRRLLDQVREMMEAHEQGEFRGAMSLPETIRQWLAEAMDVDVKLFAAIDDAGLGRSGLRRG
jgi:hemerythrin